MLGFYSISGSPIATTGGAANLKLGSATVSCSATTTQVGLMIGVGASSNSSSVTTAQVCKKIERGRIG